LISPGTGKTLSLGCSHFIVNLDSSILVGY
jgi:hypothetical protein